MTTSMVGRPSRSKARTTGGSGVMGNLQYDDHHRLEYDDHHPMSNGGRMPWKKEHKTETRSRILEAASAAIREKGVAGVGVAGMMESAGLTHGGFYAHFESKD